MVFSQLRSSRSNKTRRAMGFSAAPRKNSWIWHEHPRTDESVCVIEESTKQIKYQAGHQVPSGYFGWVLTHKRFMFFLALRPRRQCFDWVALVCNWHRLHFSVSFTTSLEMPFTVGTRDAEREREFNLTQSITDAVLKPLSHCTQQWLRLFETALAFPTELCFLRCCQYFKGSQVSSNLWMGVWRFAPFSSPLPTVQHLSKL